MTTELKATVGIPLAWFKSTYSGSGGGECVEVARTGSAVCVRDSKMVDGPQIRVARSGWAVFVGQLMEERDGHR
ncbi:DUF397 domain-containing protein [Streptomyces sp. 8N114]|uniref:DUF397 domain-containing protein n=1 Tax=Streptomyces sp. 8N114 TaxID=3457419 RepID=UPI003FD1F777